MEPRVRNETCDLLRALAISRGIEMWDAMAHQLLEHVDANLELDEKQRLNAAAGVAEMELDQEAKMAKLEGLRMVHETEGWKGLETALLGVGELVEGCGHQVMERDMHELDLVFDYIKRARTHPNRFVREAGLRVVTKITNAANKVGKVVDVMDQVCQVVKEGLEDNWSQVRYAGTVAVRKLLEGIDRDQRWTYYEDLMPRMCLNRHYVAEGVRTLSKETWREVVGKDGREGLRKWMGATLKFFVRECRADNHAVREAACMALGEICGKLEREYVVGYVGLVIDGLMECFKDESWPVRDHAAGALGVVVGVYGEEVEKGGRLVEMERLFEEHLGDNIGSVRKNCARAFAECCVKFGRGHTLFGVEKGLQVAKRLMDRMKRQKEERYELGGIEKRRDRRSGFGCGNPFERRRDRGTGFGCASKLARDNDEKLHTNQVMYSCGSLAPKLRRGAGCMDHGFTRERKMWELAEGGMILWGDLVSLGVSEGWDMFDDVLNVGTLAVRKVFGQDMRMRESWLDVINQVINLGEKVMIEKHLDQLVENVEKCQKMDHGAVKMKAAECSKKLQKAVGIRAYGKAMRNV